MVSQSLLSSIVQLSERCVSWGRPHAFDVLELANQLAVGLGEPSSDQLLELTINSPVVST